MYTVEGLKHRIAVAAGNEKADLVLKNGRVVNVFTNEIENADVAICGEYIAGIGKYEGKEEIDLNGAVVCPGLIDGHIHIESSMLAPEEFARAVVPHGTTAVVTDPHEIANVVGTEGIDFMLEKSEKLPMDVYFMLPSCVPSTPLDEAGAVLGVAELAPYYEHPRVLGLAELMNSYGTVRGDGEIVNKIADAVRNGKHVDGHAPGLAGRELNAYAAAGVQSDHECSTAEEGIEKIKRGQWVMIREGTAAKNLKALLPLFGKRYYSRCMLVTDDRHPGDLRRTGHMDYIIREAIRWGENPVYAVKMASFNPAQYFGLKNTGAVAPGFKADLTIVNSLESFEVTKVYKCGKLVAENGELCENDITVSTAGAYAKVYSSFNMEELEIDDFRLRQSGKHKRVIGLVKGELLTRELIVPYKTPGENDDETAGAGFAAGVETDRDIVKLAVIERHRNTGHIGLGFVYGYGIKSGAVASSISHDSHNLIVIGTNDADMVLAANTVRKNKGGIAVVNKGAVLGELALPVAGLMCEERAEAVQDKLDSLKEAARGLGVSEGIDPFMTLAFVSLPVIPQLRLTTNGLVDVGSQSYVPAVFD